MSKELIERLRRLGADSVGNYGMPICVEAADLIEQQQKRIDELGREIAEYKQDAERYRMLRSNERFVVDEKCADGHWEPVSHNQLDAAIDRARGDSK